MPRRSDELDPEPAEVPGDRVEHVDVRLAAVAPARAHLPELERAAEESAGLGVERRRQLERLTGIDDQVDPLADGEPVVPVICDRTFRAGVETVGAEETSAQVYLSRSVG